MMRWACSLGILLLCCSLPSLWAQGGRLQKVREAVRDSGGDDAGNGSSAGNDSSGSDDPWGEMSGELLGQLVFLTLLSPFYVPHAAVGDDLGTERYFPKHPYHHAGGGCMELWSSTESPDRGHVRGWMGRLSVENGNDFDGLNRAGGQLLLDTTSRLGLQTSWNHFYERLPGGASDDMVVGDVNLTFRFAQSDWATMRAGLGFRVLTDRFDDDWGFNFTYGGDLFPIRPVILSGTLDLGNVGSAFVVHGRATAGVLYHGWELFGGYDFLRIGAVNLQGPMVGLRWWF